MTERRAALENRIASQKLKIQVLDDRIGRLMSQRVDAEDKLAALYAELNRRAS